MEYRESVGPPNPADIIHDLGFFGHYLHMHEGGRGGKRFVLCTLAKCDGHITQRELLERTSISSAAMSEVLAKLETEQLIIRKPYKQDRRQLDIELTSEGTVQATRIREERTWFEQHALSCLTNDEQSALKEMCDKLVSHWKQLETQERQVMA